MQTHSRDSAAAPTFPLTAFCTAGLDMAFPASIDAMVPKLLLADNTERRPAKVTTLSQLLHCLARFPLPSLSLAATCPAKHRRNTCVVLRSTRPPRTRPACVLPPNDRLQPPNKLPSTASPRSVSGDSLVPTSRVQYHSIPLVALHAAPRRCVVASHPQAHRGSVPTNVALAHGTMAACTMVAARAQ